MKKAEFAGPLVTWIVVIIIIGMSLIFGFNSISSIRQKSCIVNSVFFESNLIPDVEAMSTQPGSVSESSYPIPCDVDKVYIIDTAHADEILAADYMEQILENVPIVYEEVKARTGNNLFLFSGNKFEKTMQLEDVVIKWPYYQCFEVKKSRLDLFLEGSPTGGTFLKHKDEATNCGPITIQVLEQTTVVASNALSRVDEDGQSLESNDIADKLDDIMPPDLNEEEKKDYIAQRVEATEPFVEMARITDFNEDDDTTTIDIIIRAEDRDLNDFFFIEDLPKECVGDLREAIGAARLIVMEGNGGGADEFKYQRDPQMMWNFGAIDNNAPRHIRYDLEELMDKDCRDLIRGIGFET